MSDENTAIKKAMSHPDSLHYKGVTITPGGFTAGETVYRTKATGGDIPTAFSAIPYEHADAYSLSEFFGDARQSRVSLMAEGKTSWGTLRGYYEADWLGTGITSNNNQSNSYVLRQRVIWGQAETNNHWAFTGGQLWSLATEDKKGISNLSGDIMTPQTIDPNYVVGLRMDPPIRIPHHQDFLEGGVRHRCRKPASSSIPRRWPEIHPTR